MPTLARSSGPLLGSAAALSPIVLFAIGACGGTHAPSTDASKDANVSEDVSADGIDAADDGAVSCGAELGVSTASAAAAELPATDWSSLLAPMSSRPVSEDLRADADLVLDATTITPPAYCASHIDGCLPAVRYTSTLAGVTLEDPADDELVFRAQQARIDSGVWFRLRAYYYSEFPFFPVVIPAVEIIAPCSSPCDADERRCPSDRTCYGAGELSCIHCEERARSECACVGPEGDLPEGTWCQYPITYDLVQVGTCAAGLCTPGP